MPKLWRVPAAARQWRRDIKAGKSFRRIHEPTELMGGREADSYNDATQTSLVPVHRILTRMAHSLLPNNREHRGIVDFGTGPAASHIVMARAIRGTTVLGIEGHNDMIALARKNVYQAGLEHRMHIVQADCTSERVVEIAGQQARLATSVFLAHQFRDEEGRTGLDKAVAMLKLMSRVIVGGGSILVLDFIRPPSEKVVDMIVDATGPGTPVTDGDYKNSLKAAFSLEEWREIIRRAEIPDLQIAVCKGPLPIMIAVYKVGGLASKIAMDTGLLPSRPPLGLIDRLAALANENLVLAKGFRDGGFSYI